MSLDNKLRLAAERAAREAAANERARCLWVLDQLLQKAEQGLQAKLLTATEERIAQVRMELTRSVVMAARQLIMTGIRPKANDVHRITE